MIVWGVSPEEVTKIIRHISASDYDGNLIADGTPTHTGTTERSGVHFKLRVSDSAGPGAKITVDRFGTSKKGYRRTVSACWHAHRDVMLMLFDWYPEARLKSAVADYRGAESFLKQFPGTGYANVGSLVFPVAFQDSCLCELTPEPATIL
jgi:hypothetical protein